METVTQTRQQEEDKNGRKIVLCSKQNETFVCRMVRFTPLTSKRTHFLRMTATSLDCRGATSCFTVKATFLRFFHLSGSSW